MAELSFKQLSIQRQQLHEHQMDRDKHRLMVVGQRWAGSLAMVGVGGSVAALFAGANGLAVTVITGEFVTLIGLFLYRQKNEKLMSPADETVSES